MGKSLKEGNMTKTAKVLRAMLLENTGKHMLDSGGAYGRAWQENKGRDFASEPAATITVEEGFIDIRRSTYHFLVECLEFDEAMTEEFYKYAKARDKENRISWLALMEEFLEGPAVTGIYGESDPITVNTYNHDSLLDQVIQYVYFEIDEQGYVLLQIHGGCDARGGYTAPKAFRCNIDNWPSIFSEGRAEITCKGGDHQWYVEEGLWETAHYESADPRFLTEFPIIADEANYHIVHKVGKIAEGAAFGVIWQDSTGVHCPLCGNILEVW